MWNIIINIITVIILSLTALFIYKQVKATSDSIKLQYVPSIETFLVRRENGNSFVFLNSSSTPGMTTFDLSFKQNQNSKEIKYKNRNIKYRIPAEGSLITQNTFFTTIGNKDDALPEEIKIEDGLLVIIKVLIRRDLDNITKNIEGIYTKEYRFWKGKWDESTVGFPDILLFSPKNSSALKTIQEETWNLVNSG